MTMPIMLLLFVAIALCFTITEVVHMFLGFLFAGNLVFLQIIMELMISFVAGMYVGKYIAKKILYLRLKEIYKQKNKEKGE